jgi:hypothetical protein
MICEGLERLALDGFRFSRVAQVEKALVLTNVTHVELRDSDISQAEQ